MALKVGERWDDVAPYTCPLLAYYPEAAGVRLRKRQGRKETERSQPFQIRSVFNLFLSFSLLSLGPVSELSFNVQPPRVFAEETRLIGQEGNLEKEKKNVYAIYLIWRVGGRRMVKG